MLLPNISAMKKWVNNFFPGSNNQSQDFLQLVRQSDGTILGWIDERGIARGSLANPPASLAGPGLINFTTGNNIVRIGWTGGANNPCFTSGLGSIGGFMFFLPTEITTNKFAFLVENSDASDQYDIGIYGPYAGVETTLPLVSHTGPQTYASSTTAETAWVNAPVSISAGYYFLLFTTAANLPSSGNTLSSLGENSGGGQTNLSYFAFAPTVSTTSTASTLPSTVALSVAFASQPSGTPLRMQFALF